MSRKLESLEFYQSNFGEALIRADYDNQDREQVTLELHKIANNPEHLAALLNGFGNMLRSISATLRSPK